MPIFSRLAAIVGLVLLSCGPVFAQDFAGLIRQAQEAIQINAAQAGLAAAASGQAVGGSALNSADTPPGRSPGKTALNASFSRSSA